MNISLAQEHFEKAQVFFTQEEYQKTLGQLTWGFKVDSSYYPVYQLAKQTLEKLGANEEILLFEKALAQFENFQAFYDLGYHFIDVGNYELAQPFLERALHLSPNNPDVGYELSLAYTARFQIAKALQVLQSVDDNTDFWVTYRRHLCLLLNSESDGIETFIADARKALQDFDPNEGIQLANQKLDDLAEILLRYQCVNTSIMHIREWHFIQYGAAILDYFEDSDEYVAGGRYVASWGSLEWTRTVLEKLKLYVQKFYGNIVKVFSLQDRDSEILARAISGIMNIPFEFLDAQNTEMSDVLIVAGDARRFNGMENLIPIRKNQLVFALNLPWLEESMICPDVVGFMTQTYSYPWQGNGFRVVDNTIENMPPDLRNPQDIAQDIIQIASNNDDPLLFDNVIKFYKNHQEYLSTGKFGAKKRLNFTSDSPVPGSYFT